MKRNRMGLRLTGFFVISLLAFSCVSHALTIEVFTHNPKSVSRVSGHQVVVHDLSAPEKFQSPTFSASPARAEKEALNWLKSSAGQRHISTLRVAHKGHIQAIKYGLKKIPAVVFESGTYVVYGSTNVRLALKDYYAKREKQ